MAMDKRDWANIAAGTVAAIAIVFGISQCNGKDAAVRRAVKESRDSTLVQIGKGVDDLRDGVRDLGDGVKDLHEDAEEIKDMIEEHDETVNQKLDTLKAHCDSMATKVGAKKPVKKPVAKKKPVVAPIKAEPVKLPEVKDQTPVVLVTKDTVLVRGQTEKPAQTVVITGDNNGNVIVNNGGVVNANGNVNGHDNNVNAESEAKRQQALLDQYVSSRNSACVATGRKVKCH